MSVYRVGSNKSSVNNFPNIRPTLDLDFANSKTLDPRITFTRASGGSYVGADGLIKYAGINEARFDHDPETGESFGLLIEEPRTNVFTWSEDFTTWGKPAGTKIIPNAIIAPDGTLTAAKLVEDSILEVHYVFKTNSVTSGTTYTVSGYVKAAERTEVFLNFSNFNGAFTNNSFAYFNLISETFRAIGSSVTNYGSEKLPNGWYRIWITAAAIATVAVPIISPFFISDGTTNFYVGDGTSGIYIWGAQLEEGSFPTSYIPTQGSTRTRAADSASITGKNFSEWYRQDEGTFTVKYRADNPINGQNQFLARASNNTYSNAVGVFITNEGKSALSVTKNGLFDGLVGISVVLQKNISYTTSATYKFNNLAISLNGQSVFNDNSATIPDDLNRLDIGRDHTGAVVNGLDAGKISRLTYYPKRLPNSQLQALTR